MGCSVPLQLLLLAPRYDKCAMLRAAIIKGIPGLCPPLALNQADVISRTEVYSVTEGGGPRRTVEKLQVATPGGGDVEVRACKGVEVVLSAEEQEALASGEVVLPAGFIAAVREVDAWVALTQQVRRVRGEEAVRRCFLTMHGWDVLELRPGTFKIVTYL